MCGEKSRALRVWRYSWGSPPHTRGKECVLSGYAAEARITPAYAGKRRFCRCRCRPGTDHPRIRGEKASRSVCPWANVGSPPHTRGKVSDSFGSFLIIRITPAYAGKSLSHTVYANKGSNHPRIRGEKPWGEFVASSKEGSPPHTRGKDQPPVCGMDDGRITPAYAGKSARRPRLRGSPKDHPRIRGEKICTGLGGGLMVGSPPHTRGKVQLPQIGVSQRGITPAYAGKRLWP